MKIEAIRADSDFSNSVIPANNVLLFLGVDENNNPVLRYKDSSGAFHTLGGESYTVTTLTLSRPSIDEPLFLKLYVSATGSTSDMTLAVDTTTAEGRARVKAYFLSMGEGSWQPVSSSGLTVDYAGAHVSVDLTGIPGLPGYIFYRWETDSGSDQDYESIFFPSCTGNTAYAGGGYDPGPEPVWPSETSSSYVPPGSDYVVCSSGAVITSGVATVEYPCIWESTIVDSLCILAVTRGGLVNNTTLTVLGQLIVDSGGTANETTVSGGVLSVSSGGTANSTTVNSNGWMAVLSGGTASCVTVSSGATLLVSSGGTALAVTSMTGAVIMSSAGAYIEYGPRGSESESSSGTSPSPCYSSGVVVTGATGQATVSYPCLWENTTLNNSGYLFVNSGGTANVNTLNSNGYLLISSGGMANSTTLYGEHALFRVLRGGMADVATVNPRCRTVIDSGATATNVVENGGTVIVSDGGYTTFTPNTFSNLVLTRSDPLSAHYDCSATVHSGTTANYTAVNNKCYLDVFSGGRANNTTVNSGGSLRISNLGVASATTLYNYGRIDVYSGGTASDVVMYGFTLAVASGGVARHVTVSSGGSLSVIAPGNVIDDVRAESQGKILISSGASVTNITEAGGWVDARDGAVVSFRPNTFSNLVLSSVNVVTQFATVHSGTTAVSTTVISSGCLLVYPGGVVSNTDIGQLGLLRVCGGSAENVEVKAGGGLSVSSGGSVSYATVSSGGSLVLSSGASATSITENGGMVDVSSGAVATFASNTFSGLTLSGTNDAASATVHLNTIAVDTQLGQLGYLAVYSGGLASNTSVGTYGGLGVFNGGSANKATVAASGLVAVSSGGLANSITLNSSGTLRVDGGAATSTIVNRGGILDVLPGGLVDYVTVSSGGILTVQTSGTATHVTSHAGAIITGEWS